MTEPPDVEPWERRKRMHRERIAHADRRARALFAADKAANAAALRRAVKRRGDDHLDRIDGKVSHYRAALDMLPSGNDADPVAARLRAELDRLAAERAPAANRSQLRSPS
jgi:hypothetical protein